MDAILFDLDDTLVVEEPAARAAFAATAQFAARLNPRVDPTALALAARSRARDLWRGAPTHPYCEQIGLSSWEGLWCRYEGEDGEIPHLRDWAPTYRRESWRLALAEQGVDDAVLAEFLGERFAVDRRTRIAPHPDARPALEDLRGHHRLAVVTNGAACLQREKLAGSGLAEFFDAVVVSADVGAAKPAAAPFARALELLGSPRSAVMIGDSYRKDIHGARGAGIAAVWLNRDGAAPPITASAEVPEIATLAELSGVLANVL